MVPGVPWSSFLAPEAALPRCPCARARPTPRTRPRDAFSKFPSVHGLFVEADSGREGWTPIASHLSGIQVKRDVQGVLGIVY